MSDVLHRLDPAWVGWIAHQLFEGIEPASITSELAAEGLPQDQAATVVAQIAASPVLRGLATTLEAVHLRRAFLRTATEVPRLADPALYLHGFASAQTPVLFEGFTRTWPALNWTWSALSERLGTVQVEVSIDRDQPDGHVPSCRSTENISFGELIERVLDPHTANSCYVTASDSAVGPLADLLHDLGEQSLARTEKGVAFWIGAAGAHTPLHRDLSTTLIAPMLGSKRVVLVPPEALLATRVHRYWAAPVDLTDPDLFARTVEVHPGDALSIPAGWWHDVTTLEPCFLVTLADLKGLKNRFDSVLAR